MKREVVWRGVPMEVAARRIGVGKHGVPMEGAAPARQRRHGRVTGYHLLGYFLTGSVGEHPVKNS